MGKYCLWAFTLVWLSIIAGHLGSGLFDLAASGQFGFVVTGIFYVTWAICCIVALPGALISWFVMLAFDGSLPMPLRIVPIIIAFILFFWAWRL